MECCICHNGFTTEGYIPYPLKPQNDGRRCCDVCKMTLVDPVRLLCASLNLKTVAETEEFGKRWLQAWRVRHYKRREHLLPDLVKEYRRRP